MGKFLEIVYKGIKDITLWVLCGAALLGLLCKWATGWRIFELSKDTLEMASWALPLIIIAGVSVVWIIVIAYYWFEKNRVGGTMKYYDKYDTLRESYEELTQKVDKLEKEIGDIKHTKIIRANTRRTKSRAKRRRGSTFQHRRSVQWL